MADCADDFADAVIRILNDPAAARAMGAAGQDLARNFSPEHVAVLLEAMLRCLVPSPEAIGPRVRWLTANVRVTMRAAARAAGLVPR